MAFTGGFGRESGPSAPPKSQPLFGQFSPPSLFPTNPPAVRSYRESSDVDALPAEPRTQLLVSRPQDLQQAQTPFFPFGDEDSSRHSKVDAVGGAVPLPRSIPKKKVLRVPDFPSHLVPLSSGNGANAENGINKDLGHAVPKRTRSPPPLASQVFQGNSHSTEGDNERELEAKAKRLARFKTELSAPIPNISSLTAKNDRPKLEKQRVIGNYMESAENFPGDVDIEGPQTPGVIIGLCPDMCPGSEREERERKGDLDHYERLDGDRNQSSRELAVKKYTRTAEREARLIRPLPILQKTMDYLLNLLDQPYSDSFLALYNFLWDRMRAIRMDLRMQHIFNLEAITMLEQMIRLHIIAMHELCEYTKGEGFSEGFDAHLNIEQMNKTSVELFQMYDDYRKKGVHVPTEKEFRGYYALLKLDKHPGYKVEPGELSLDLAKMTPEIRQTKEVLLARNVARSCRTGNFISFFRLGMKASYLQACLMHAHFSKLRTQALASLHSGLLNNQGLPIAHVAKWLGLENEDVESLLEYHGFSFKDFGELYMVKDGPFLNIDKDFPTRCSVLVHSKKSRHVVEDISSPHQVTTIPPQASKEPKPMKVIADKPLAVFSRTTVGDLTVTAEKVRNIDASPSSERGMQFQQGLKRARNILLDQENHPNNLASSPKFRTQMEPVPPVPQFQHNKEDRDQHTEKEFQPWNFSAPKAFSENLQAHFQKVAEETPVLPSPAPPKNDVQSNLQQMPLVNVTRHVEQEHSSAVEPDIANSVQQDTVIDKANGEEFLVAHDFDIEGVVTHRYDEEVAKAKLKLFLRLWRRRCASKRVKREQNRLAAIAALNSLSVGPPLQRKQDRRNSYERFNIDEVMNKRYKKHEESWSTFSVSDIVTDILCERNPRSSCICWKVVLCYHTIKTSGTELTNHVTHYSADQWLHSKFMPSTTEECNDDLVISAPGVAIWRKWIGEQSQSTCLSVIKSINFSNLNQDVAGANGVVFLLSEGIEWDSQKVQLQNLIAALPCRSCMPLLILCGSSAKGLFDQTSSIVDKLGLHELDKSRISSFLIVHLHESQDIKKLDGYFSDKQLREGLKWLASKSHLQPVLWSVKTRALVLSHLNTSLDALDHKGVNIVGPNHCISAFNEALDKSVEDIVAAASANPIGWPCPELSLLYDADEFRVSKLLLPSIGWSSAEAIEPFLSALRHCKLPVFLDDTSFLNRGSNAGDELEEQRLHLQDCLISYLNQSSRMMNLTMAMKEASIMLQKNARLELHNTSYYVIPNWVHIFRRIFNWQLNALASNSCSTAYILEKDDPLSVTRAKPDIVPVISEPSCTAHPSLDEMLEVSLTRPAPWSLRPPPEAARHVPATGTVFHNNPNETNEASPLREVREHTPQIQSGLDFGSPLASNIKDSSSDFAIPSGFAREANKLTRLIEECNMMQNKIAEKLSIYF